MSKAPLAPRREALAALLQAKDPSLAATLHVARTRPRPRRSRDPGAVGLRRSGDAGCVDQGVQLSRADGTARRLEHAGCAQGDRLRPCWRPSKRASLPRADLTADLVRQLRNLKDAGLDARIGQVWGTVRETTGDRARLIAQYKAMLTSKPAHAPDPATGAGGLRQGLPAVPHALWRRPPGRPGPDGLKPGGPRLRALERARPECLDRQGLPGSRDRH